MQDNEDTLIPSPDSNIEVKLEIPMPTPETEMKEYKYTRTYQTKQGPKDYEIVIRRPRGLKKVYPTYEERMSLNEAVEDYFRQNPYSTQAEIFKALKPSHPLLSLWRVGQIVRDVRDNHKKKSLS